MTRTILVVLALLASASPGLTGCHGDSRSAEAQRSIDGGSKSGSCGTTEAISKCESVTWPRLIVSFGDEGARTLAYSVTTDDGMLFDGASHCPAGYGESEMFQCDIGYFGNAKQKTFTLQVTADAASPPLISKEIPLTEFNYCGNGVAYVIVTTSDGGVPSVSDVRYISVCESL